MTDAVAVLGKLTQNADDKFKHKQHDLFEREIDHRKSKQYFEINPSVW